MTIALAPLDPSLDALLGVLAILGSWIASLTVVPWIAIFVHEAGHVVAAHLTGARPVEAHVGGGSHVVLLHGFGTRWNLRLRPTHGLVSMRRPSAGWTPGSEITVLLAGPLASTALAIGVGALAWFDAGFPSGPLHGLDRAVESAVDLGAFLLLWQAASTWRVGFVEIDGELHESDMKSVLRLRALEPGRVDGWRESMAFHARCTDAWELHVAGRHAEALDAWRALPECGDDGITFAVGLPLYIWPVEGAGRALEACDAALVRIARARERANDSPAVAREVREHFEASESHVRIDRAFFALLAGGPENLQHADEWSRAELLRRPKSAAALRTRGLVDLELGAVGTGIARLQRAWRLPEGAWSRALCALYLAYGHALRGDVRRARKFLAKCRRLDAHSPMLPVLVPRIDELLSDAGRRGAVASPHG